MRTTINSILHLKKHYNLNKEKEPWDTKELKISEIESYKYDKLTNIK